MRDFLYYITGLIAKIHEHILSLNDAYEYNLSDKQLHFLVMGVLGMAVLLVVHPLFIWLSRTGHVLVISWIYAFTVIIVVTFAIEIGQKITHTGVMEFEDIVFGVCGFMLLFMIFAIIRGIILFITDLIKGMK